MASLPIIGGVLGGVVLSEGYRYIKSWFYTDDSKNPNTQTTININISELDTKQKNVECSLDIEKSIVLVPSNGILNIQDIPVNNYTFLKEVQRFDANCLKSVNALPKQIEYKSTDDEKDIMNELRRKMSNRRKKLVNCD